MTWTLASVEKLATTVLKLANMSKDADTIIKGCRHWESNTMNNEVEIETTDNNLREARKIGTILAMLFCYFCFILIIFLPASDNEMKFDNLARSLAMMEDELKRADERVKNAETRVVVIEDELQARVRLIAEDPWQPTVSPAGAPAAEQLREACCRTAPHREETAGQLPEQSCIAAQ